MTYEEVKELEDTIKENGGVYPVWTNNICHLGAGIDIIRKYDYQPEIATGHDIIYYGVWTEFMTADDLTKLFELNWGITEEFGDYTFYHFT